MTENPRRSGPTGPARRAFGAGSALRVSENGRHLVHPDGTPFFWLGDTAWLLFQMTTREDADLYLKTRARQGFTVIQAALVMGEERVGGTLRPDVYGRLAFQSGDPARPDVTPGAAPKQSTQYDYWDHADYIIERAGSHGLTLGLLPLFVGYGGTATSASRPTTPTTAAGSWAGATGTGATSSGYWAGTTRPRRSRSVRSGSGWHGASPWRPPARRTTGGP